jgi:hypothetical protein
LRFIEVRTKAPAGQTLVPFLHGSDLTR